MKRSIAAAVVVVCAMSAHIAAAADVFLRCRIVEPATGKHTVEVGGYVHESPWQLHPTAKIEVAAGQWSEWLDIGKQKWPLHGRLNRVGGVAEWPALRMTVEGAKGCSIEVQLADSADEKGVVHQFTEKSESGTIAFLLPTPLREQAKEFEIGSQMAARHLAWAREASGENPAKLKDFTLLTALWGHYDPALARQEIEALKLLGFNVIGNYDSAALRAAGVRTYGTTWSYGPDPAAAQKQWDAESASLKNLNRAQYAHFVVGDEVMTLGLAGFEGANRLFREYLRDRGEQEADYPAKAMLEKTLPRDADLPTRRLMYHAAKFGHLYSAKRLRATSDMVRATFGGMKTETLPSDHGFFNAWGPPHIGMSYRMLDLFELGAQRSVDEISAEDWLGLNHMYGPAYTWTGAQSFAYFNAICRSAMLHAPREPMMLRGLITPSDDRYLRLKAYSAIGQGAKSLFFWTFGPTYISTENYWSDLRSEYEGIAKLSRALAKSEEVLVAAKPVRDPVAILYSVSHDIWHSDDPAAFVEKRLLWHALRHLHVQPDFLREEDVAAGRLKDYKALYVTDWCISRTASAAIDQWVKAGGVIHLSAGAATRDEYYEPYVPPFAATAWPADAATAMVKESHAYNERVDLPTIKPMATVRIDGAELPVIGCRLNFRDNASATLQVTYGNGKVIAFSFLPMLAYGQLAGFKPETLEEKWPDAPRRLIELALKAADVTPVAKCDREVVETSLLTGEKGSAVVLVNYTYQPIDSLTLDLKLSHPVKRAVSTEGREVAVEQIPGGVRLRLPLEWTDIVLLE